MATVGLLLCGRCAIGALHDWWLIYKYLWQVRGRVSHRPSAHIIPVALALFPERQPLRRLPLRRLPRSCVSPYQLPKFSLSQFAAPVAAAVKCDKSRQEIYSYARYRRFGRQQQLNKWRQICIASDSDETPPNVLFSIMFLALIWFAGGLHRCAAVARLPYCFLVIYVTHTLDAVLTASQMGHSDDRQPCQINTYVQWC